MKLICFWEVFFYQIEEGLTNIRFDVCIIRWIIPYYFVLLLFIVIFTIFFGLMYSSISPEIHFYLKHPCNLVYVLQNIFHLMTNQIIICLSISVVVLVLLVNGLNSCLCKLVDYLDFCRADMCLFANQKLHQDS